MPDNKTKKPKLRPYGLEDDIIIDPKVEKELQGRPLTEKAKKLLNKVINRRSQVPVD